MPFVSGQDAKDWLARDRAAMQRVLGKGETPIDMSKHIATIEEEK